jgi:hypothetical protein
MPLKPDLTNATQKQAEIRPARQKTEMMKTVKFNNRVCKPSVWITADGKIFLDLLDIVDDNCLGIATVEVSFVSDELYEKIADRAGCHVSELLLVKDFMETRGILRALVDAEIVSDTGFKLDVGIFKANICIINSELFDIPRD